MRASLNGHSSRLNGARRRRLETISSARTRPSDTALIGLAHSRPYTPPVRGALDAARAADALGAVRANYALDVARAADASGTACADYAPDLRA